MTFKELKTKIKYPELLACFLFKVLPAFLLISFWEMLSNAIKMLVDRINVVEEWDMCPEPCTFCLALFFLAKDTCRGLGRVILIVNVIFLN